MCNLLMCLTLLPIALGADPAKSYTWKPAPQAFDVVQGKVQIVLSDPLPQNWALTVVSRDGDPGTAKISAGSVDLDGLSIERVNNLDLQRLEVKPGAVFIRSMPKEAGLAVCVTVPAGTQVAILHADRLLGSSNAGLVIQDGRVEKRSPKICASLPLLLNAICAQ